MSKHHFRAVATLGRSYGLAWRTDEGYQSYADIFTHREPEDRFVILWSPVPRVYLLIDMWDTSMDAETLEIYMPVPMIFPTEDAAVMAARLKL